MTRYAINRMIAMKSAGLASPPTILKGNLINYQTTLKGRVISHHSISTYPPWLDPPRKSWPHEPRGTR